MKKLTGAVDPNQYSPLESIDISLVTPEGLQYIRCDENLTEGTVSALMSTESRLRNSKKFEPFLYLFEEPHSPITVYRDSFLSNRSLGFAHVSTLILEKPEQSFAELVAGYANDRNIPFLASYILLNDYRITHDGAFCLIRRSADGTLKPLRWTPRQVCTKPPVNMFKMSDSGYQSTELFQDDYLFEVLRSVCFNRKAAAKLLHVSRQTLTNRLKRMGYLTANGDVRENFEEYIEQQLHSIPVSSEPSAVPIVKKGASAKKVTDVSSISDEDIIDTYIYCAYSKTAAAQELGITVNDFKERLAVLFPGAEKYNGIPNEIIAMTYAECERNAETAAAELNISVNWMLQRLEKLPKDIRERYSV